MKHSGFFELLLRLCDLAHRADRSNLWIGTPMERKLRRREYAQRWSIGFGVGLLALIAFGIAARLTQH